MVLGWFAKDLRARIGIRGRQFVGTAVLSCLSMGLNSCDKPTDPKTFVERGQSGGQFDTRPVPLKIGDTYLGIPRNYIDSFERTGKDGPFIKTGGALLFAHWPTMEGRTPSNRDEIYSAQSRNGYHTVSMLIGGLNGLRYPDDDDEFEFVYRGRTAGYPSGKDLPGPVSRDGSIYGYERYIRQNNWRIAFSHGPTALILRKLDRRGRITSYVYCDSHEIQKAKNYSGFFHSGCDLYVHHRGFEVKSHFREESRLVEVAELEAAIRSKMDEFIAVGEAIRSQGGKAQ